MGLVLDFDGVDDRCTIPHFQDPSSGSWTFLVVFQSRTAGRTIVSQVGSLNAADWLAHTSGGNLGTGLVSPPVAFGSISLDTWYMGAIRRDASAGFLKLNLRRTGSNAQAQSSNLPKQITDGFHVLGYSSFEFPSEEFGFPFDGQIAFQAHWNRALSDSEMTEMFNGVKEYLASDKGISL